MRCKQFDYSGKTLISLKDYEAKKNQEFLRIRSLSTKSAVWISNPRQPGTIYECDALTVLNKIKKTEELLVRQGTKTIKDLKQLSDEDAKKIEGIWWKVLTNISIKGSVEIDPVTHQ